MGKRLGRALGFAALLTLVVGGAACNKNKNSDVVAQGNGEGGPPQGMGGPPGMGFGGRGGPRGPVFEAMTKLFKGPQSLRDSIGRELDSDAPSWDTIQAQTKEFAQLASSLSKYDPPRGDKGSWEKLTASFSKEAEAWDHAATAKNKDEAKAIYTKFTDNQTCKECHQAHKGGPGGMRGGFRGQGGPPKGPPAQPQ